MEFCSELKRELLNGATIVAFHKDSVGFVSLLVRLPQGRFERKTANSGDLVDFEYKVYKVDPSDGPGVGMYVSGWRNGHLTTIKREVYDDFRESSYYARRALKQAGRCKA